MPIDAKDVEWVEEPPMNFWESTFLPAVFDGLRTTGQHVADFQPITEFYPEQKPKLPSHYRGVHRLNRDDKGRVKCVACMMCATACPANCISIVAQDAPMDDPAWVDRDKFPKSFEIDELKCIYCGMCEEACPVDSIELTYIFDLTGATRQEMIFDKEKLLSVFDQTKDSGIDPIRTHKGVLGHASDFENLHTLGPATTVNPDDRSAQASTAGVIE
jgi:NADH-quinone oxidoreductase subunit I